MHSIIYYYPTNDQILYEPTYSKRVVELVLSNRRSKSLNSIYCYVYNIDYFWGKLWLESDREE